MDWFVLLVPAAVLAALMLFRFVGCDFGGPDPIELDDPYHDGILKDSPVVYYRLQEAPPPDTATDEAQHRDGKYVVAPSPLQSDPAYLSPQLLNTTVEPGLGSLLQRESKSKSVRFVGSFVLASASGPPLDDIVPPFSLEAVVLPEWNLNQLGLFYCVMENSMFLAGHGSVPGEKNCGFAIYAGPDDPANAATSPYCWQLFVGTGAGFQRCKPLQGGPVPPVKAEPTYLAATFDATRAFLYAYSADTDINSVKFELERPPYIQAVQNLFVGIATKALVGPFPSPQGFLYPFVGRMAEVAIYRSALAEERIISHILSAFNS